MCVAGSETSCLGPGEQVSPPSFTGHVFFNPRGWRLETKIGESLACKMDPHVALVSFIYLFFLHFECYLDFFVVCSSVILSFPNVYINVCHFCKTLSQMVRAYVCCGLCLFCHVLHQSV